MAIKRKREKDGSEGERHILGKPIIYQLGIWGSGYLPKRLSYWFARRVADISYILYRKAKQNVKNNLRRVFPDLSDKDIAALTISTFRNYSTYLVDYGRFRSLKRDSLFEVMPNIEGTENIKNALKEGNGVIMLTAHLGNWELGAIFFGRQDIKINVVTFRDGIHRIDDIKGEYRKQHNINTVILGESPFAMVELLNALQRNEVVAMLVDRYENDNRSMATEFFGKAYHFPSGPLVLAKKTGAALIPGFVVRDGETYRAIAEKPIFIENDGDLQYYAQKITAIFEYYIRQYPDQWYNFVEL
ncbi:MAG: lysophospholipid acyltransferase family protein [Deltaproteobacteria bacterium]|nr:lysophospholipid acyltransferase family protein [Deltaproteobacteria bacterium]